ncbi:MAG: phosphonoacetaldehyde reductase [Planctomycetota bacterium]
MAQHCLLEAGALRRLGAVVANTSTPGPRSVFLVSGDDSFANCGAAEIVQECLAPYTVQHLQGLGENPTVEQVQRGLDLWRAHPCDAIVAVGGGTVMDTAKLINAFAAPAGATVVDVREAITDPTPITAAAVPLIAAPTTAGSGSEATHFAVIYDGHTKHSIADECMRPDVAVIDPLLTESMARPLTAVTGLDALCQGIESMWSVNATETSLAIAREAVSLAFEHLPIAYSIGNRDAREAMARAAHLAGRAIDITKTTASHAISYALTSRHGVPHGHAVALSLGTVLLYNYGVSALDVTDPRGARAVRGRIGDICKQLGARDVTAAREKLTVLLETLNLPTHLHELGITSNSQLRQLVDNVNTERLANNPRRLDTAALERLVAAFA